MKSFLISFLFVLQVLFFSPSYSSYKKLESSCGNIIYDKEIKNFFDQGNYEKMYKALLPCAMAGHNQSLGWLALILAYDKKNLLGENLHKREIKILGILNFLASKDDVLSIYMLEEVYRLGDFEVVEANAFIAKCWKKLSEREVEYNECYNISKELQNLNFNSSNKWGLATEEYKGGSSEID